MKPLEISGRIIARNTLINFIGQVVPLVIGIIAIPYVVRGLGTDRFGLLSLAWVVLGYFTIFDLGLGRATTKYVAEALGKGEVDQVHCLLWTAVIAQLILSVVGGLVLVGVTPLLVERAFNIPPGLVDEAKLTFYLLALGIPVILVSSSFSGVLEAAQRFDLLNSVRTPSSACNFLIPLIVLISEIKLPGIVLLILGARFMALLVLIALSLRVFPALKKFSFQFVLFPHLLVYGGWVTVSSIVGPILVYLDRFLIASILSMASVAYYTAPYEAITRLWIIPISLVTALFPVFSTLNGIRDQERIGMFFARSVKYVLIALGPIVLILILFSKEILQIWLGNDFAIQGSMVLQILSIGVLINSLAHVPYALLQGTGRPDIPAKFHLLELPIHFGIAWILINRWGIAGAAVAWTLRVLLDTFLIFMAVFKVSRVSLHFTNK
jgi:O-antigen/teichoic acid export membrane protein